MLSQPLRISMVILIFFSIIGLVYLSNKRKDQLREGEENSDQGDLSTSDSALVIHSIGSENVITRQEIMENVTATVMRADYNSFKLNEKVIPLDAFESENLYGIFEIPSVPNYCIFSISPKFTHTATASRYIEIDYIGLKKQDENLFFEITYRSSKKFSIEILYSPRPRILQMWSNKQGLFYAYPVKAQFDVDICDGRWCTESFSLTEGLYKKLREVAATVNFLERLNREFAFTEDVLFFWDGTEINKDKIEETVEDYRFYGYNINYTLILGASVLENEKKTPLVTQKIDVRMEDGDCVEGWIRVSL